MAEARLAKSILTSREGLRPRLAIASIFGPGECFRHRPGVIRDTPNNSASVEITVPEADFSRLEGVRIALRWAGGKTGGNYGKIPTMKRPGRERDASWPGRRQRQLNRASSAASSPGIGQNRMLDVALNVA